MRTPLLAELPPEEGLWLEIDTATQRLSVWDGLEVKWSCDVSTGANGTGEEEGSGATPLGWHTIRAAIGAGEPAGAIFRGRRPTGEVYTEALAAEHPGRDWILTRILWLGGLEPGRNRGGNVDSQRRYIYLHGTPPSEPMGVARSHGCIRVRDDDLLALFEIAVPGTPVWVHD
ncbi:L,D-transpeptidase catalytic domain [Halomonas sp. THAF5a]|uniref:L,D-transpeptidase n=1 Tax=Halomonas sp. THAF5a TaxID=2587844 RepID=UPI001269853C|nr:L,D-transpeptidase [Halomonas sp. THAF5a]QFU01470.1 L,D-transpeptidase catalytic domain [Halomonas sp. THAF5a]